MYENERNLMSLAFGFGSLVSFVMSIVIMIVIATTVRQQRPDAYKGLLTWSIGSIAWLLLSTVLHWMLPYFTQSGGVAGIFRAQAALSVVGTLVYVGLVVVMLRGIIAIARPRAEPVPEGEPPYR